MTRSEKFAFCAELATDMISHAGLHLGLTISRHIRIHYGDPPPSSLFGILVELESLALATKPSLVAHALIEAQRVEE